MKKLAGVFVFFAGVSGDKCTELCAFDGPSVCTDGSWTKNGNICQKYVYRGSPEKKDYCYHTSTTRETCPGNGLPVKVGDVDGLIAHKSGERTTTTIRPPSVMKDSAVSTIAPVITTSTTTIGAWKALSTAEFWEDVEKQCNEDLFFKRTKTVAIYVFDLLANKPVGQRSNERALRLWETMKGPALLRYTMAGPPNLTYRFLAGTESILVIANPLIDSIVDDKRFFVDSGISDFCTRRQRDLVAMLRRMMSVEYYIQYGDRTNVAVYTMMRNLQDLCPNLVDSPDVKAFVLHHKLMHRFIQPGVLLVHVKVEREKIFEQSFARLKALEPARLSLGICSVKFEGENAFGEGVRKDWFSLFAKKVMESGILTMSQEGAHNTYLTEPPNEDMSLYDVLGRFLALAVIHRRPLGITFPSWFFARIFGNTIALADIQKEEPHVHAMLNLIMSATSDEALEMYPMEIDGEEVQPTLANREEVVARRIRALIPGSVGPQFERIRQAFLSVIPIDVIQGLMSPSDVRNLIVGTLDIDVEDMIANMEYSGGTVDSPQVVWLHRLLRSLTPTQLRQYVHLTTSSSHVPFEGFAGLKPKMTIDLHSDVSKLPKTSTCFNQLHLPRYRTEEELRDKVSHAIANAEVPMFYAPN
jgi:hypothetical protein